MPLNPKPTKRAKKVEHLREVLYPRLTRIPIQIGVSRMRQYQCKFARLAQYYFFADKNGVLTTELSPFGTELLESLKSDEPVEAIIELLQKPESMQGMPSLWNKCLALSALGYEAKLNRGDYLSPQFIQTVMGNPMFWRNLRVAQESNKKISKRREWILDCYEFHDAGSERRLGLVENTSLDNRVLLQSLITHCWFLQEELWNFPAIYSQYFKYIAESIWPHAAVAATGSISELGLSPTKPRQKIPLDWEISLRCFFLKRSCLRLGRELTYSQICTILNHENPDASYDTEDVRKRVSEFKSNLFVFQEYPEEGWRSMADFNLLEISEYGLYNDKAIAESVLLLTELTPGELIFEFSN